MDEEKLVKILEQFTDEFLPALDCDGCTRFVAFMLQNKKIDFEIYIGKIMHRYNKQTFPIHYWIETKQGTLFDFKTLKWLGVRCDKIIYLNKKKIDKQEFLAVGGQKELVLGVLMSCGVEAPLVVKMRY